MGRAFFILISAFTFSRLRKGDAATGEIVRAALQGPPLFEFGAYRVHRYPENTFA